MGLSSRRGQPVYNKAYQWAVRGANQWGWVWERRIDEFCRATADQQWMDFEQDREKWFEMSFHFVRHYFFPQIEPHQGHSIQLTLKRIFFAQG